MMIQRLALPTPEKAIERKIANRNPGFTSPEATPHEPPIHWIKTELWRIIEMDECGLELGIKTKETPKTKGERQVRRKGSTNDEVIRDGVPQYRFSGVKATNFNGDSLVDGFVANYGDGAALGHHCLTDSEGKFFMVPVPDSKGGTVDKEVVFFSSNEREGLF